MTLTPAQVAMWFQLAERVEAVATELDRTNHPLAREAWGAWRLAQHLQPLVLDEAGEAA